VPETPKKFEAMAMDTKGFAHFRKSYKKVVGGKWVRHADLISYEAKGQVLWPGNPEEQGAIFAHCLLQL